MWVFIGYEEFRIIPKFYKLRLGLDLWSADDRFLSYDEMEIVEIVPDLVSVVLSHATILEEFQTMREKLEMKKCVLQQANRMLWN